jgi:hypothetical protein
MPVCTLAARRAACIRLIQSSVAIAFDVFARRNPWELQRTVRDHCALLLVTPARKALRLARTHWHHSSEATYTIR